MNGLNQQCKIQTVMQAVDQYAYEIIRIQLLEQNEILAIYCIFHYPTCNMDLLLYFVMYILMHIATYMD